MYEQTVSICEQNIYGFSPAFNWRNDSSFEVWKSRQTLDVKFDFDQATIKDNYSKDIDDLAQVMKNYPELNVVIESHTDSLGTDEYNK